MRHPADRFLFLFTGSLTLFVVAITILYSPSAATVTQLALLAVLVAMITGRLLGAIAAAAVSLAMTIGVGALTAWPYTGSWWLSEQLPTQLLLLAVSTGAGVYVALLFRRFEQAQAARHDVATAAELGVGLVPQALSEEALGTLLAAIEQMAGATCVSVLVPDESDVLAQLRDGRPEQRKCTDSSRAIAELMRESHEHGKDDAANIAPVLTSTADLYLPVRSGSGFEGVLYADRAPGAGRWSEADIGIVGFASALLGALLERDRLQTQSSHIKAMEEADALKANILLSISHDLRTPLAASGATVASLIDSAEQHDKETLEDLQSIAEDLASLDWRIGELIDSARLEAADWTPNIDWNDGSDLCNLVLSSLTERAQARLRCDIAPDTPPFQFDLVQMARALHHLVENALSYSPPDSEVTVGLSYDAQSARITVSDHGPGVAEEEREAVFDKFYRGTAGAMVPHGTGLGLAIASSIVTAHRGTIEIENLKPTGARFTIALARRHEDSESE